MLWALTHPLTADNVGQPTEEKLSTQSTNGGSDLDTEILVGSERTICGIVSELAA